MKKKQKLTKKQAKFVKAIVNTEINTVAEAARIAGYALKNARQAGYENLQKPTVQSALQKYVELLNAAGATDEVTAQRLAEGLHAKKVTMFGQDAGPDFEQRGKYIDRINKIKKYLDNDETPGGNKTLILVIGDKGLDEII